MLAPLRTVPAHPVAVARFGLRALLPASRAGRRFSDGGGQGAAGRRVRALHAAADAPGTGGFGLLLTMLAHSVGWPVVEGGSARAHRRPHRASWPRSAARCHRPVDPELGDLPPARATLLDITPRQFLAIAGDAMPLAVRRALSRFQLRAGDLQGRLGAAAARCRGRRRPAARPGRVHLGGTLAEIARSEAEVTAGQHPDRPYCMVAQPGVVDPTRAPAGQHTLWGYCHVPAGSTVDMTGRIEAQIERFAPGFRDLILARSVRTAAEVEEHNPNYVGGDIDAGLGTLRQTVFRPAIRWNPYRTALKGVYLCSASTPPGGGVHGMCGLWAARAALADLGGASGRDAWAATAAEGQGGCPAGLPSLTWPEPRVAMATDGSAQCHVWSCPPGPSPCSSATWRARPGCWAASATSTASCCRASAACCARHSAGITAPSWAPRVTASSSSSRRPSTRSPPASKGSGRWPRTRWPRGCGAAGADGPAHRRAHPARGRVRRHGRAPGGQDRGVGAWRSGGHVGGDLPAGRRRGCPASARPTWAGTG